jgi:hypothetical protein
MSDTTGKKGVIILHNEPDGNVLAKWLAWLMVMIIFVIVLLWYVKNIGGGCSNEEFRRMVI